MRVVVALVVGLAFGSASAQVACTGPEVLCSGDPCVVGDARVASPCELDFGARTLVVRGRLRLPDGGRLRLAAGRIELRGGGVDPGTMRGPDAELVATGDIHQRGLLDVSGAATAGTLRLRAGGDVIIDGNVRAQTGAAATAPSGQILVEAEGTVSVNRAAHVGAQGRRAGAGHVVLSGRRGAWLTGHLDAGGADGGFFELRSAEGDLYMGTDIRAKATGGRGGTTLVEAGGTATVARSIDMQGPAAGGTIRVQAPTVHVVNELRATARRGAGGAIQIVGNAVAVDGNLKASGPSAAGEVAVYGDDVRLASDVEAVGSGGGDVVVTASRDLHARGRFRVGAGGCVGLDAGATRDVAGVRADVPITTSCGP